MWTAFFQTFNPWAPMSPDEVEALYVRRPKAPGRSIARRIMASGDLGRWVLCGARGCGKSTELAWIAHELRHGFRVVHMDISHALPDGAGMLAVLIMVGAAVQRQIEAWQGEAEVAQARATRQAFAAALNGLGWALSGLEKVMDLVPSLIMPSTAGTPVGSEASVLGTHLAKGATAAAARLAEKKAIELRGLLDRDGLGGALRPEDREKADAVADAVNSAISTLSSLAHQPVVLLIDGVDRQARAEIAFADANLLTRIDASVVLTAPIQLRHDTSLTNVPGCEVVKVPNLKVVDQQGEIQADAVELLVQMVQRRLDAAPDEVRRSLRAEQVRPLAHLCSGIPRELIEFIRKAGERTLEEDRELITVSDLQQGVKDRRLRNGEVLRTPDWDVLSAALETGEAPGEAADPLLFNNLLICYYNDEAWFRPHETLVEQIRSRRAPTHRS